MLDELKVQNRELKRKLKEAREKQVEESLKKFMELLFDERISKDIKESVYLDAYKANILDIFND